jgi:hypothetical protein
MTIRFMMEEGDQIAAKASGAWPRSEPTQGCPFHLGDFISFPNFPRLMYKVTMRYYMQGSTPAQSEWIVKLEPVPNPFAPLLAATTD